MWHPWMLEEGIEPWALARYTPREITALVKHRKARAAAQEGTN